MKKQFRILRDWKIKNQKADAKHQAQVYISSKKKEEFSEKFKYKVWTEKTDECKYGKMLRLISVVEYHEIMNDVWSWIEQELKQARIDGLEEAQVIAHNKIPLWCAVCNSELHIYLPIQERIKQLEEE